jgi:hypothetical protein
MSHVIIRCMELRPLGGTASRSVAQPLKNSPTFCGTQDSIKVFERAFPWYCRKPDKSTPCYNFLVIILFYRMLKYIHFACGSI